MLIVPEIQAELDRTEAFRDLAQRRAGGEMVMRPSLLQKEQRRLYVRRTLREDHQFRILNRPEGAQAKFDKLADNAFTFFRGTALLYYRDYAGTDWHLPLVFTIGDIHPENFGVMPNEDGAPFFGVNDFDEADFAPFSYDVKRGAVGFYIGAKEQGLGKKKRKQIVCAFVQGYLDGLVEFARDDRERWHQYRIDNSPKMIRQLLKRARRSSRKKFLADLIDLEKERFVASDEIVPHSKHVEHFQKLIDKYKKDKNNHIDTKRRADGFFQVKDVAVKKDSGTASLGLDRFYVLINGPSEAPDDNLILEMKQTRPSVLRGLVPELETASQKKGKKASAPKPEDARRIVLSHDIHLAGGDPFYGRVEHDGRSFLVRERSPFKDEIDLDDLSKDAFVEYAGICGKVLAQTHARSDEDTGIMEGDAEKRILGSISPALFVDDVARFARTAAKRIYADFKLFQRDHELGAFQFVNSETP